MSVTSITDSRADRDILITENMGLVHTCAHRFTGKGIEYEDLFQAGCMGLVKAFDAFDRERGVRFSTYAVPVILGEIRRLFRDGGTVKVSRTLKELSIRTAREREKFALKEGREPTIKELAERLGVSQPTYAECERGSNMRIGTLQKIVTALGGELSFHVLIEGQDYNLQMPQPGRHNVS